MMIIYTIYAFIRNIAVEIAIKKREELRGHAVVVSLRRHVFRDNLHLMTVLELGQDNPSRYDTEKGDSKVEANTDEMVGTSFRLHSNIVSDFPSSWLY